MRITVHTNDDDNRFDLNVKDDITNNEVIEHVNCWTDDWDSVIFMDGDREGEEVKRLS